MQKQTKFILFIILLVLVVGGLGTYFGLKTAKPGQLDEFAQALSQKGAKFYGAFWCSHCQAQKAEFGTSKQYLPYVECSTADNSQVQICKDNKIEGYPTWTFKDGITLSSEVEPIVCGVKTDTSVETDICKNISSQYFKTWFFPDYKFSIKSPIDPIKEENVWKFSSGETQISGEVPLSFLAEQIQFTLPQ